MKTKIVTREELGAALRRVLSDVTDADERHFVVGHLFNYANTMELVQRIPTALRLKFFACAFVIYDYLRSNGQLNCSFYINRNYHEWTMNFSGIIT